MPLDAIDLYRRIGGCAVYIYQPTRLWEEVALAFMMGFVIMMSILAYF
jgi:hypothetical protein